MLNFRSFSQVNTYCFQTWCVSFPQFPWSTKELNSFLLFMPHFNRELILWQLFDKGGSYQMLTCWIITSLNKDYY